MRFVHMQFSVVEEEYRYEESFIRMESILCFKFI
jgi:hypothetical protein